MGFLVGTSCYEGSVEANQAFFSAFAPSLVPTSTHANVVEVVPASMLGRSSPSGFTRSVTRVSVETGLTESVLYEDLPQPVFPACNASEAFVDGLTVGWAIAAAMVAVAALKLMQRAR